MRISMTCEDRIFSNDYLDVIAEYTVTEEIARKFTSDYCFQSISECFGIISMNRDDVPLYNIPQYGYSYIPKVYTILQEDIQYDTFNLEESGIIASQKNPLELTGRGVIIGFIDTGIDYTNDVFRNADGTTRILALWDQTITGGTSPDNISYGTLYTEQQINEALQSDDPYSIVPSRDEVGHGTAIASVTCGSRLEEGYAFLGAAPDAKIVVVKLKQAKPYLKEYYLVREDAICFQETDILSGIRFLDSYAVSLKQPVVICMALGSNLGGHTGDSKLADYMTRIAERKSRAIVVGAGNEGAVGHHYQGELSATNPIDNIEINVSQGVKGFMVEFWGQTPYLFGVKVKSPLGEVSPPASLRTKQSQSFDFILDQSLVTFDALTIEQNTGRLLVEIRVNNPSPGIWTISVANLAEIIGGEFDLYLPLTEFMTGEVTFLRPDPFSTLVNPSYSAPSITVVPYNSRTESISPSSGRGYSLTGAVKPDLAVPGVDIPTILGNRSGSSFAAAIAAGGIAQLMQWAVIEENDIMIDSGDIKNYLIRGAVRDKTMTYPNQIWGYGIFNINNVFRYLSTVQ